MRAAAGREQDLIEAARTSGAERHIESLRNTLEGIEVRWVCWCGTRGTMLTGRLRSSNTLV